LRRSKYLASSIDIELMAQLIVRNLDEELVARLKMRAAEHGRSAEAEYREILRQVLAEEPRRSFKELAARVRAMTAGRPLTPARFCSVKVARNGDVVPGERLVAEASVAVKWVVTDTGRDRAGPQGSPEQHALP
jgi:plasmid stability protein